MSDRPWLLDLFCGAGGAGEGYRRAGFHVVSVDIAPQKHNPHELYQDDALHVLDILLTPGGEWQGYRLHDFQAIHASPPCQGYSRMRHLTWLRDRQYPLLIDIIWHRLMFSGVPWIIENVEDAPMSYSTVLCGVSFGLPLYRHRRFGSSHLLFAPAHQRHLRVIQPGRMLRDRGRISSWERATRLPAAMGCSWMTQHEVSQAIPPAYTEWLGRQLMQIVRQAA